jgi:Uma2 family endonuclease
MIQAVPKQITFDEFIAWYPENSEHRYELRDGEIIQMPKPIGKHSQVGGYNGISDRQSNPLFPSIP